MNEASWPIFIAAPFIVPSVSTSLSAESIASSSMRSSALSFERTRLAALAPA